MQGKLFLSGKIIEEALTKKLKWLVRIATLIGRMCIIAEQGGADTTPPYQSS